MVLKLGSQLIEDEVPHHHQAAAPREHDSLRTN